MALRLIRSLIVVLLSLTLAFLVGELMLGFDMVSVIGSFVRSQFVQTASGVAVGVFAGLSIDRVFRSRSLNQRDDQAVKR